jgi:hypothetical protein
MTPFGEGATPMDGQWVRSRLERRLKLVMADQEVLDEFDLDGRDFLRPWSLLQIFLVC